MGGDFIHGAAEVQSRSTHECLPVLFTSGKPSREPARDLLREREDANAFFIGRGWWEHVSDEEIDPIREEAGLRNPFERREQPPINGGIVRSDLDHVVVRLQEVVDETAVFTAPRAEQDSRDDAEGPFVGVFLDPIVEGQGGGDLSMPPEQSLISGVD